MNLPSFRLYRRIFIMLLAAQVLIAAGAVIATIAITDVSSQPPKSWAGLAKEAATVFQRDGRDGFDKWQKDQFEKGRVTFLVGPENRSVGGLPLPGHLVHWLRMTPPEKLSTRRGPPGHLPEVIMPVPAEIMKGYRLVVFDSVGSVPTRVMLYRVATFSGIAIVLIAIVTLLLTRSLVRPIMELRQITHAVAAGQFSKRVGLSVRARKDEIGELAADFDTMSERIEDQFQNQRQLFRDVSHELKSPLARLQLAIEILRSESQSGDERWLSRLDKESTALSRMIDRILMLAQIDPSAVDLRRGRVDMESLMLTLIEDARFEAAQKGHSIEYQPPNAPTCVSGSQTLLASAIENVIRNAILYGAEGHPIQIGLSRENDSVVITVSNRGESLRSSDLRRIFEPFYRAPGGRVAPVSGQGIGLTITRNAVQAHNGTVEAKNHPEGGLVIRIVLSLDKSESE